jgi:hypothetical protein
MNQPQQRGYQQQGYAQNYPSQQRANQQDNQIYVPPQKKHTFIAMGLIIVVILGAIGLYFAIKPKLTSSLQDNGASPELQAATPVSTTPTIEITTLKLCDSVDENFVCKENTNRIFKRGDTFYVYAEVTATAKDNGDGAKVMLNQEIIMFDKENKIVMDSTEEIIKNAESVGVLSFKVSTPLTTLLDATTGTKTISVVIQDKYITKESTKTIEFELK